MASPLVLHLEVSINFEGQVLIVFMCINLPSNSLKFYLVTELIHNGCPDWSEFLCRLNSVKLVQLDCTDVIEFILSTSMHVFACCPSIIIEKCRYM